MLQPSLFPHTVPLPIRVTDQGIQLFLKVTPKAARTRIGDIRQVGNQFILKIYIQSPAEKGKANQDLILFLSQTWRIPQQDIHLITGQTSRYKTLLIHNITETELRQRLIS